MSILGDPIVEKAFKSFMRNKFHEDKVSFWADFRGYREKQVSSETLVDRRNRARDIYTKYIKEDAKFDVGLDPLTRSDIEEGLQLDSDFQVHQKDETTLRRVFDEAHEKIFNELKFEFMPKFFCSRDFIQLETFEKIIPNFNTLNDLTESIQSSIGQDIEFIMDHPWGCYYFKNFLYDSDWSSVAEADECFELLQEIEDFKMGKDIAHRRRRISQIFKKYYPGKVKELKGVYDLIHGDVKLEHDPPRHCLDSIQLLLKKKLEDEYLPRFRESEGFGRFKALFSGTTTTDPNQGFNEFPKLIHELQDFKKERNYEHLVYNDGENSSGVDESFHSFLSNRSGRFYFKKFSRQVFQEESYLFWLEVQHFKNEEFIAPADGSFILSLPTDSDKELMLKRARIIVQKFIKPGSTHEINIPYTMKMKIAAEVEKENHLQVFGPAEKEILQLMERNMWSRFKDSYFYSQFRMKMEMKRQRKLSGVVNIKSPVASRGSTENEV
jgi:hypothetical protein